MPQKPAQQTPAWEFADRAAELAEEWAERAR